MDPIRAALLADFESFHTDTRCGTCGERLIVRPNENHGFDATCGGCAHSTCGVRGTDVDWIRAEFCEPFEETGVPAPVARAGEIYHERH